MSLFLPVYRNMTPAAHFQKPVSELLPAVLSFKNPQNALHPSLSRSSLPPCSASLKPGPCAPAPTAMPKSASPRQRLPRHQHPNRPSQRSSEKRASFPTTPPTSDTSRSSQSTRGRPLGPSLSTFPYNACRCGTTTAWSLRSMVPREA